MSKDDLFLKFYTRGVRLLGNREHSESELRKKLLRGGWSRNGFGREKDKKYQKLTDGAHTVVGYPCLIDQVITQLKTEGFLSDERYSESYIRMRMNRGYGPAYLTNELRKHGISEELIEDRLKSNDISWVETAKKIIAKRYCSEGKQPASWEKKARFLKNRGFSAEVILNCLGNRND